MAHAGRIAGGRIVSAAFDQTRERYIRSALESQGFMRLLQGAVDALGEGYCVLSLPHRPELLQQDGIFHGGAIAFLVDNTATAAAGTLSRPGYGVLTAEYKLNLLAPARGERLVCRAEVVKSGRMLTVVEAKVHARSGGEAKLVALGLATIANLPPQARPRF